MILHQKIDYQTKLHGILPIIICQYIEAIHEWYPISTPLPYIRFASFNKGFLFSEYLIFEEYIRPGHDK